VNLGLPFWDLGALTIGPAPRAVGVGAGPPTPIPPRHAPP